MNYDFTPDGTGRAPYRNNPNRWLVQAREREQNIWFDYQEQPRRVFRWTRWRTVKRFATPDDAFIFAAVVGRAGLSQWRVTWGGKVQTPKRSVSSSLNSEATE
jgi:hypothetical protein